MSSTRILKTRGSVHGKSQTFARGQKELCQRVPAKTCKANAEQLQGLEKTLAVVCEDLLRLHDQYYQFVEYQNNQNMEFAKQQAAMREEVAEIRSPHQDVPQEKNSSSISTEDLQKRIENVDKRFNESLDCIANQQVSVRPSAEVTEAQGEEFFSAPQASRKRMRPPEGEDPREEMIPSDVEELLSTCQKPRRITTLQSTQLNGAPRHAWHDLPGEFARMTENFGLEISECHNRLDEHHAFMISQREQAKTTENFGLEISECHTRLDEHHASISLLMTLQKQLARSVGELEFTHQKLFSSLNDSFSHFEPTLVSDHKLCICELDVTSEFMDVLECEITGDHHQMRNVLQGKEQLGEHDENFFGDLISIGFGDLLAAQGTAGKI